MEKLLYQFINCLIQHDMMTHYKDPFSAMYDTFAILTVCIS